MMFLPQIHETVDQINAIKLQRDFYLGFAQNPQVNILLVIIWSNVTIIGSIEIHQ